MTFAEAMAAEQRQLNLKATIQCVDGFLINATEVMSVSIDEGGQMPLGSAVSARYTLELPNADGEYLRNGSILGNRSLTGARVTVQIGVYHDGAWDWQPLGMFIVEKTSAREHDTRIRLTGNDPLILLDVAYGADIIYRNNTTLNDILAHIRSKGFVINGTLATNGASVINFTPDWGDEPTVREVLGYVAQICGSFVRCDRSGNIELAPANSSTTHTITTDRYLEFTDDERYFNFNRIKVLPFGAKKSESHVQAFVTSAAESAANTIVIEGNPLFKTKNTTTYSKASSWREGRRYYVLIDNKYTYVENPVETSLSSYYVANTTRNTTNLQAMVNNLKTALTGMSFRALNFTWRGNPQVMVGDKVAIVDTRGVTTTTVNLQQTLRFDQGFKSEISCPLDLQAVYPSTITSSGRVVPPYFGEGSIDGSVIVPESITGDLVVAGGITAEKIASKTVTADEIAAKTITADEIKAGTITADEVAAKTITADEIAAGTITATEIGASQITATHIGTNEIVANAANIKDGVITNAKIANGTIENAKIKDATIETAKIKDAAITTAKIADAQVTNAKIANATIETAKIKDAAITTAKIQDAQITNAKIAAAGIDFANIKDVNAGTAIFRTGVGDALYLDRLVVNDANFASAIAGKLMIRDTDGKLYRISVNSSGAVTATQVQVNGDSLTDNAVMSVSQRLLWRQATQPSAPWVGMLWLDTTTEKLKRCTAITPSVAWEVVPAGEVHTAVIDVDDNGMNVLSGGNLNLLAGGNLNIKNLGNTANVINMDNTGLTLFSTGQLKLQSTDSIIIGGSPFSVGGTNLLKNSDFQQGVDVAWLSTAGMNKSLSTFEGFNRIGLIVPADTNEYIYSQKVVIEPVLSPEDFMFSFYYRTNPQTVAKWGTNRFLLVRCRDANDGILKDYLHGTEIIPGWTWGRAIIDLSGIPIGTTSITVNFCIRSDGLTQNDISLAKTQLEKGTMATDWSPSPQDTVDALAGIGTQIGGLQTQVDGKIESWWLPTASDPSVNWTTSELKTAHTGDMWYNTTTKKLARWNGTAWESVIDQGAVDAYTLAETAKDTADGKRRVFVATPTTPYDVGDLWVGNTSSDLMRCGTARASGAYVAGDWVKATKYTDDSYAANFVDSIYAADKLSLQSQIDGKIETWYYAVAPTTSNAPASSWTTTDLKNKHIGDLYYDTATGFAYRYKVVTGTYSWERIKDSEITDAMNIASTASDTADKKRQVFVSQPVPPYDVGDLWAGGSTGDLKRCSTAKAAGGSYAAGDWVLASKYTDDTGLTNFISNTYNPAMASKTTVFYGPSKPTYTAVGDIWYESANGGMYRCANVSTQAHTEITSDVLKQALSAATAAQTTADGKINTFVGSSTPTALAPGDLWLDTSVSQTTGIAKNIWKRATVAGTGGWVQYLTASGYLVTSGMTIDGNDLNLTGTGNLNLISGSNININTGGNLNVLNGGDIEMNNGGEINVASGGKINITTANDLVLGGQNITAFANESINLAVSNIQVGGTNLLKNSDFQQGVNINWASTSGLLRSLATFEGYDAIAFTVPASTTEYIHSQTVAVPTLTVNEDFILSFYYRTNQTAVGKWGSNRFVLVRCRDASSAITKDFTFTANIMSQAVWSRAVLDLPAVPPGTVSIAVNFCIRTDGASTNGIYIAKTQLERGNKVTDWGLADADPASGVKTSSVEVNTNGIYMDTTGNFNVNAGVNLSIKGGSGANSIGISNNPTDTYFMWAGNASAADAPFSVKRDGSVKATKIQHEYSQSFWDMADATFPAEFPVYIPSGYAIDSVLFSFQRRNARTFAKAASSGGGQTSGPSGLYFSGASNGLIGDHQHVIDHTHAISSHTHGINYGINEKTTNPATSCGLFVNGYSSGTYTTFPTSTIEVKSNMSAGWNTITVQPNNDARIVAYVLVKLTPT